MEKEQNKASLTIGTKAFFRKGLHQMGIKKHPKTKRNLKTYKTYILQQLYIAEVIKKEGSFSVEREIQKAKTGIFV